MFIPEEILKCVALLGYRRADKSHHMSGSAFWIVRRKAIDIPESFGYLVTAKHVIENIRDKKGLDRVYIRVNLRNGTCQWINTALSDWVLSADSDVAAVKLGIRKEFEHSGWPLEGFATKAFIDAKKVGAGYEIFVAGMFSRRLGVTKNIPIVRMGNIASIPNSELIQTKRGPLAAFLVEARSTGGLSGSPVFIDAYGTLPRDREHGPSFFLIGLVHGHFDEEDFKSDELAVDDGLQKTSVNMGIAVVIPAEEITKVIAAFSTSDAAEIEEYRRRNTPTRG